MAKTPKLNRLSLNKTLNKVQLTSFITTFCLIIYELIDGLIRNGFWVICLFWGANNCESQILHTPVIKVILAVSKVAPKCVIWLNTVQRSQIRLTLRNTKIGVLGIRLVILINKIVGVLPWSLKKSFGSKFSGSIISTFFQTSFNISRPPCESKNIFMNSLNTTR